MTHESPSRLHLPRIHGQILFSALLFWSLYIAGIVFVARLILKTIP